MLSRFATPNRGTRSFYEDLRARDDGDDLDEEAGLNVDEENLRHHFHDSDAEGLAATDSRITVDSVYGGARGHGAPRARGRREPSSAKWPTHDEDADNDVPASLLVEDNEIGRPRPGPPHGQSRPPAPQQPAPIAGPSSARSRAQWEAAASQQRLHGESSQDRPSASQPRSLTTGMIPGGPREKALWKWVNTSNLDSFMRDVYDYYEGGGLWCILCANALWLLSVS